MIVNATRYQTDELTEKPIIYTPIYENGVRDCEC